MSWARFGRFLRITYLLRVPVLTLLAIAGLGVAAVNVDTVRPLLGGLLDLDGSLRAIFFVSWAAFQAATAALATINVIFHYGDDRFQDPNLNLRQTGDHLAFKTFLGALIPPITLLIFVWRSTAAPLAEKLGGTVGGLLCVVIVVLFSKYLVLFFSDPGIQGNQIPYLIFPFHHFPHWWLSRRLEEAYRGATPRLRRAKDRLSGFIQSVYEILLPGAQGYFVSFNRPYRLSSGHIFMTGLVGLSTLVYAFLGWGFYKVMDPEDPSPWLFWQFLAKVPSLAFVLLLLMLACFVFGGLSFFADRFRAPVLLTFFLLALTTGRAPEADHFYRSEPVARLDLPAPAEALRGRPRPILVASAGGGIQAAAWTARVLKGLDDLCRETPGCEFKSALAAMSGVSGGSAGLMHFGAHWNNPAAAVESASASSLEHISWGLLNPDLRRAVFPWWPAITGSLEIDRAWALERAWEIRDGTRDVYLRDWASRVRKGGFPAFLFSTTIVEHGAPMVFATTRLDQPAAADDGPNSAPRVYNFHQRYGGHDVRVSTAARLSSSFPYVSPTARSLTCPYSCPDLHLVDGGYYDNYGVHSLLYWLDQALASAEPPPEKTLVLMIRSFPSRQPAPPRLEGWLYQLLAPAGAYLNVRETAQLSRTRRELDLYRRSNPSLEIAQIEFPDFSAEDDKELAACKEQPLSWKLRQSQKDCIESAWKRLRCGGEALSVIRFLTGREEKPKPCASDL